MTDRSERPFSLRTDGVLEPEARAVFEEGAVYGAAGGAHDPRLVPLLAVAWLDEPESVSLDAVVEEDMARLLRGPGDLLLDREAVRVGNTDGVRTFSLHLGDAGVPTASEQWRLIAAGRRWTISAMTALGDQPRWGPRLADVATSFRVR